MALDLKVAEDLATACRRTGEMPSVLLQKCRGLCVFCLPLRNCTEEEVRRAALELSAFTGYATCLDRAATAHEAYCGSGEDFLELP